MKTQYQIFQENKKQAFDTILAHISEAIDKNHNQIYIKSIKIENEEIDVVASKELWPDSLNKALAFYKSIEDYMACANCQKLLSLLEAN